MISKTPKPIQEALDKILEIDRFIVDLARGLVKIEDACTIKETKECAKKIE